MNKDTIAETVLGAVVLAVAIGFLTFAVTRAGQGEGSGGYPLEARFNRIDGIAVGADVRLSGVKIGAVSGLELDPETYMARVTLSVDPKVKVPDDSVAKVASDGLLGGAYIGIEPGGSEAMLASGGEIAQTQGSVDLLTVLASVAGAGGGGQSGSSAPETQETVP